MKERKSEMITEGIWKINILKTKSKKRLSNKRSKGKNSRLRGLKFHLHLKKNPQKNLKFSRKTNNRLTTLGKEFKNRQEEPQNQNLRALLHF